MKLITKKFFIIFMCAFLVTNSAVVAEVEASSIAATLAAVVSGAGSALAAVGPLLLVVAVCYCGYTIYKRRDAIKEAFNEWWRGDEVVSDWMNDTADQIDTGTITDGSTIKIPSAVLSKTTDFVNQYAVSFGPEDVVVTDSPTIYINSLSSYVSNSGMKQGVAASSWVTNKPVMVIKNLSNNFERILCANNTSSTYNMLFLSNMSVLKGFNGIWSELMTEGSTSSSYSYFSSICTSGTLANNDWPSYYTEREKDFRSGLVGDGLISGTSLIVRGNVITGFDTTWPYKITLVIPKNSAVVIAGPEAIDDETGKWIPGKCQVITSPVSGVLDNPLTKQSDYTYTPSYVIEPDKTESLPVVLTPDVVTKMKDYIVEDDATDWDVIKAIDAAGVKEIEVEKDILDVITDLPGTITQAVEDALAWLFVPDQAKVDAFVLEAKATIEGNGNLFTYPIELVIRFLNGVYQLGSADCILVIPRMEFKGYVLYEGSQFNLTDFVNRSEFDTIYGYYITITDFIMIVAVLNLAIKKGSEIIRGN